MRNAIIALLVLVVAGGAAAAADLPVQTAPPVFVPPPVPAFTWTGFFVGGNAGYTGTTGNDATFVARGAPIAGAPNGLLSLLQGAGGLPMSASEKRSGFIGGGQIGYNLQLSPAVVAGVEADIQGLPGSGSSNSITSEPRIGGGFLGAAIAPLLQTESTIERRIDYLGTVRGRLGYSFDRFLVYGTGGLAYGKTKLSYEATFPILNGLLAAIPGAGNIGGSNANSNTSVGYTVGGGVEYAISNHWSMKAEGLYFDLGRQSVTTNVNSTVPGLMRTETITASVRNNGYIARAGLNYKFGADPVSVVARY